MDGYHNFVGYFYLVVEEDGSINTTMAYSTTARTSFIQGSKFPPDDTVYEYYTEQLSLHQ